MIDAGPDGGVPVVLCHGTPGSGLLFGDWAAACAARGVRLIGYSRPGYGTSTRQPGRVVADAVADVEALADALDLEELLVLGHSGGGPHALACAALLPGRVQAVAVIAAAAPVTAEGLDWLAGQDPENVIEFRAAQAGGETLAALLEQWCEELLDDSEDRPAGAETRPEGGDLASATSVADADRAATNPRNAAFAQARRAHALTPGIWGWYDDDLAETMPWGFEPAGITRPVAVWHGGQDRWVPIAHGRWLSAVIPNARAHLFADEGHYSILEARLGEVVDDLLDLAA